MEMSSPLNIDRTLPGLAFAILLSSWMGSSFSLFFSLLLFRHDRLGSRELVVHFLQLNRPLAASR